MGEIVIDVDDSQLSGEVILCRICLGGDRDGLEAPCSCCGTMKYAHRDCVQRWCDEKGNTSCEICLQKFGPGYTCPPEKPPVVQIVSTSSTNLEFRIIDDVEEATAVEHSSGASASCSRNLAIVVNVLLLIVNISTILDTADSTCSLPTIAVVAAKACGIIIPMYMLYKFASVIEHSIRRCYERLHDQEIEGTEDRRPLNADAQRP